MNRQLQASGGIMDVSPREKFGLGSSLKKFVRKIIPNEISDIAVKAAPFVAPFNPALAAAMGGLGSFDQTGRIGDSLKSAALTYGLGQGARFLGGAGLQGNPFEGPLFSSPLGNVSGFRLGKDTPQSTYFDDLTVEGVAGGDVVTAIDKTTVSDDPGFLKNLFDGISNQDYEKVGKTILDGSKKFGKAMFTNKDGSIDKAAVLGAAAFATSYAEARALANQAGVDITEEEYNEATKAEKQAEYAGYLSNFFGGKKEGGRIGFSEGTDSMTFGLLSDNADISEEINQKVIDYENEYMQRTGNVPPEFYGEKYRMKLIQDFMNQNKAEGGRIGFEQGTAPSGIFTLGDYARFLETAGDFNKLYDEGEDVVAEAGEFVKKIGDKEYDDMSFLERYEGDKIEDKIEKLEKLFMKNMDKYDDEYNIEGRDIPDPDAMGKYARELIRDLDRREKKLEALAERAGIKDGGRIGLKRGTDPEESEIGIMTIDVEAGDDEDMEDMDDMLMAYSDAVFTRDEKSRLFRALGNPKIRQTSSSFRNLHKILKNPGMFPQDELILKGFLKMGKAKGGRIKYASGANRVSELLILRDSMLAKDPDADVSDIEAEIFQLTGKEFKSVGGISNVPTGKIRKNSAGVKERDYRDEGGFVPVGIKEKADDVPAMLSKNEFVITADAVRGIGGGDVEKGSKKLYNLMKNAEQVGKA
jgi:hypothetical protein